MNKNNAVNCFSMNGPLEVFCLPRRDMHKKKHTHYESNTHSLNPTHSESHTYTLNHTNTLNHKHTHSGFTVVNRTRVVCNGIPSPAQPDHSCQGLQTARYWGTSPLSPSSRHIKARYCTTNRNTSVHPHYTAQRVGCLLSHV